jgi:integrase
MPTISLTQRAVDAIKAPPVGRVEYFDRTLPGFGLRVAAGGRKSWFVMYRVIGKKVRETIGTLASIPKVDKARDLARDSLRQAQQGVHPVQTRKNASQAAEREEGRLFAAVADRYLTEYVERNTRPATIKETRRILDRDVKPKWGSRPASEIARNDVNDLLDEIAERGALVQANRTLARLKTLFSWALDNELVDIDPTNRIRTRVKETARDRALSPDEIRYFWTACDKLGWPFGPLFKLLLVTGQRRDEVGKLEWPELDLDKRVWTIPRERAKNDRAHVVHLSDLALEIIADLPHIAVPAGKDGKPVTTAEFIFTTTGTSAVSGYSKAKVRVDECMLNMLRAKPANIGKPPGQVTIGEWILHDLRRTAATGMAGLNIAPHVVDRILNHVSGTIRGVAAVYNRHAYLEERKAALDAWSRYVEMLVRPSSGNIVELTAARSQISGQNST